MPNNLEMDAALVSRLLTVQFPRWASLSITPVESAGTDNALFRLGADMCVRLPRNERVAAQVAKEQRWLPQLAPHLPLAIPMPLVMGEPADEFPWHWSVYGWLEGETATIEGIDDQHELAASLAAFVGALRGVDATNGPASGAHNFFRGIPLAMRDKVTRESIAALNGVLAPEALFGVTEAWQNALDTPRWRQPSVWVHGDIHGGNLLMERGRLSAVIDFGGLGVGDPACDLIVAWNFLSGESRGAFRAAVAVDDATWARGRGWALSISLVALPYYLHTNPAIVANSHWTIGEVLADFRTGG